MPALADGVAKVSITFQTAQYKGVYFQKKKILGVKKELRS